MAMMEEFTPTETFDLLIFGGTGDLTVRKLLPALYHLDRKGQINRESRIIALSRRDFSQVEYLRFVLDGLKRHVPEGRFNEGQWQGFSEKLHFQRLDVASGSEWSCLKTLADECPGRVRVFYLAVAPDLYGTICSGLSGNGLINEQSRIVLEKPVGSNLASAQLLNSQVGEVFTEEQIFRIDHYLGKETVQNLMALRFANSLFEPLWRGHYIDHVQITVAEDIGVGTRGRFYDTTGALRDMVQNHLLQLLCLVAMEAPVNLDQDEIRNEKLKVLTALKPITKDELKDNTVRGQYINGAVSGQVVPSYLEDLDGTAKSQTETFVALKVEIDNWRWANVPFYLRTGKRMTEKRSEIVVQFAPVPHLIFTSDKQALPNHLVIRLQPDEGIKLVLMTKRPGINGFHLHSLPLNLSFAQAFQTGYPDAYERLLLDIIQGNPALFMRRDEVEMAWSWIDTIIDGWDRTRTRPEKYIAGTWGPAGSEVLIGRDLRAWYHEPV